MSGPAAVMDRGPSLRLKLIVFLLKSANFIWLHGPPVTGLNQNLRCLTDYLFTINCSLRITPSENTSYWLTFTETYELDQYVCMLTNIKEDYSCSFKTTDGRPEDDDYIETFVDLHAYKISLCHNGSKICDVLDDNYKPVANIKPNAPCCLTVSHNSSQHHFTWKSTYEEYSDSTRLATMLQYQLRYHKRGGKHKVRSFDIITASTNYSVDDEKFEADTEYTARVRSSPDQNIYMGQWSDWSSEVHWKTEAAINGLSAHMLFSKLGKKVFIPLSVAVLLVILLCYAPVKKWRQSAVIPTPAPYFHTLYSDFQGDFKSWVVTQENTADMLKAEETLRIDTFTECPDVQEDSSTPHLLKEGNAYSNMTVTVCDPALPGVPYAVSTMDPLSAQESSLKNLSVVCQSGSSAGDSGCWLCSDTSLEEEPPWYCNEYCTLSVFQQSASVTAKHRGSFSRKSCPIGIVREDAAEEP